MEPTAATATPKPPSSYPTTPPSLTITPPRTPTSTATAAHTLLAEIQSIHTTLTTLPSLAPGPVIDELLTRLVNLCTQPYSTSFSDVFLSLPGVEPLSENLRILCAEAEGELEKHWAKKILRTLEAKDTIPDSENEGEDAIDKTTNKSKKTTSPLSQFPYHQNYIDLSRLECSLINAFLPPDLPPNDLSIAFIGSGPLPLTSFCIADTYPHATVYNIDRDTDALALSQQLTEKLRGDYTKRMRMSCCEVGGSVDGADVQTDWARSDVVFLAALVGMNNEDKVAILRLLAGRLKKGALVVARSARWLRSLIYPVCEELCLL